MRFADVTTLADDRSPARALALSSARARALTPRARTRAPPHEPGMFKGGGPFKMPAAGGPSEEETRRKVRAQMRLRLALRRWGPVPCPPPHVAGPAHP